MTNHVISADVLSGLESAKDQLLTTGKSVLDIVATVGAFVAVAVLLFNIISLVRVKRNGGEQENQGRNIAITLAVIVLCASWGVWGLLIME